MISVDDVMILKADLWPEVIFYDKQIEMIESAIINPETYVVAGNQLGKDFVTGFITLSSFLACMYKDIRCRIVTTSVAEHHLGVLWGEIGRFVATARRPLSVEYGGPLRINYQKITRATEALEDGKNPLNYLVGRVSAKGEGMAGHHAEWTMACFDEASGCDDEVYKMTQGWCKHMLAFGNPNDCANFFRRGVKGGDILYDVKGVA